MPPAGGVLRFSRWFRGAGPYAGPWSNGRSKSKDKDNDKEKSKSLSGMTTRKATTTANANANANRGILRRAQNDDGRCVGLVGGGGFAGGLEGFGEED